MTGVRARCAIVHAGHALMSAGFGEATIKIKDGSYGYLPDVSEPAGIPFDPYA